MIKTQVAPLLRGHGFARSHGTFRRIDDDGDATLLDIQGSTGSWGDESLFYVNVGVATRRWLMFREAQYGDVRLRTRPNASSAQWHGRLRPPPEHSDGMPWTDRWSIRSVEEAEICGAALCRALDDVALPALAIWHVYYRQIEQALLEKNDDDLARLYEQQPVDTLGGYDQLRGITDARHFYTLWLLHGVLPQNHATNVPRVPALRRRASGHALTVGGEPPIRGDSGNQPSASYRMYRLYRAQVLVMFAIFGATVPLLLAASLGERDGPPLLFVLAWIAALCWNAYWFLLRLCYRLDLEQDILRWSAPLHSGHARLAGLRALRPARLSPNIAVFEFIGGPRVLVLVRRGFADFVARVQAAAPQAVVRTSWYIRLTERLPGSSGFRSGEGM